MKAVFEAEAKEFYIDVEDGGKAMIVEFANLGDSPDGCFFVKPQSWDDTREHPFLRELISKKVRVTVERIDD